MSQPNIGILTYRRGTKFNEPQYFRDLILQGRKLGANVFLFSHRDLLSEKKRVIGFVPSPEKGWLKKVFPWPDVVIDRYRMREPEYLKMRRKKLFVYANSTFTRKWKAMALFSNMESLKRWIPQTAVFTPDRLRTMMERFPIVYVKPGNGTGGSSVVRVARNENGFSILARRRQFALKKTQLKTESAVVEWLSHWVKTENIRSGNFLVQQGLNLELVPNRVVDTRLLIQKNEKGNWSITGMGMRVSAENSPTTNLISKGGRPLPFDATIEKCFGNKKAREIRRDCEDLALEIVRTIEAKFGSMFEFGLDIGVDVNGRVWLIEVNPKPSRDLFLKLGEKNTYIKAVQRPIQYAMYLRNSKGSGARNV